MLLPAFPADATTMIPAFAALVDDSALDENSAPQLDPRDMFTTSMWLATAQSSASVTTSVLPSHPKTRTAYRSALGATPGAMRKLLLGVPALYGPAKVVPLLFSPNPAVVPPTWLPWPLQSSGFGSGCGVVFTGSGLP